MADMNVSLKIVGDSASASEAVSELDKELKNLGRSSTDASSSLEKTEEQVDDVSESIEGATGKTQELIEKTSDLKSLGGAFKSLGGEIKSLGGELTKLTAPLTIIAGLGLKNIFDIGSSEEFGSGAFKEFADAVILLKDNFTELSISFAQVFLPMVTDVVNTVSKILVYFRSLDDETKKMIVTFGAIAVALGPAVFMLGSLVEIAGKLMIVLPVIAKVFSVIATALTSTTTIIIGAIAAFAGLTNVFLNLRKVGVETAEALKLTWGLFVAFMMDKVFGTVLNVSSKIFSTLSSITSGVSEELSKAFGRGSQLATSASDELASVFDGIKGEVDNKLSSIGSSAGSAFTFGLSDEFAKLKSMIEGMLSGIDLSSLDNKFADMLKKIKDTSKEAQAQISNTGNALVSNMTNSFTSVIDGTKTLGQAFDDMAKNILNDLIRIMIQAQLTQAIMGAGFTSGAGGIQGFASGGYVHGAGSSTSDSIPARLSNGEFVVRASSVDKVGVGFLNYINSLGSKTSKIKMPNEFANGGAVSSSSGQIGVEIINNGSGKEVAEASYDPKTMVVSVVLEDLNKNGPLAKGLSSTFGIRRGVTR